MTKDQKLRLYNRIKESLKYLNDFTELEDTFKLREHIFIIKTKLKDLYKRAEEFVPLNPTERQMRDVMEFVTRNAKKSVKPFNFLEEHKELFAHKIALRLVGQTPNIPKEILEHIAAVVSKDIVRNLPMLTEGLDMSRPPGEIIDDILDRSKFDIQIMKLPRKGDDKENKNYNPNKN